MLNLREIFAEVKPSWKKIMNSANIKPILLNCLRQLESDLRLKKINGNIDNFIVPKQAHIFEAFKYHEVKDLKCVIIGQDPYPDSKIAEGLSFSSSGKIPPSLMKIYECLLSSKLIEKIPETASLKSWAKQGILMLNMFLTRTPNIIDGKVIGNGGSNSHNLHKFWADFSIAIIKSISSMENVFILLWGDIARSIKNSICGKIIVLEWGHPSPLNIKNKRSCPENFINCDHFTKVSEKHNICWDPQTSKVENFKCNKIVAVFTDGGCLNNGKINAVGGIGVYFPSKFKGETVLKDDIKISKPLPSNELYFDDTGIHIGSKFMKCTNQRAELYAVIIALDFIKNNWETMSINKLILITDSKGYVMTWLGNRLWRAPISQSVPNYDLVVILKEIVIKLCQKIKPGCTFEDTHDLLIKSGFLTLYHQNSHLTDAIKSKLNRDELEYVAGNEIADKLAGLI